MYRVTVEVDFSYGHRLLNYDGKCAHPHGDPSSDERFVSKLRMDEDIPEPIKEKLLGANAARFYRV